MILLENDLSGFLFIGQVSFKNYRLGKKIYLSWARTTQGHFFWASLLRNVWPIHFKVIRQVVAVTVIAVYFTLEKIAGLSWKTTSASIWGMLRETWKSRLGNSQDNTRYSKCGGKERANYPDAWFDVLLQNYEQHKHITERNLIVITSWKVSKKIPWLFIT